jgi:hypothetical protein
MHQRRHDYVSGKTPRAERRSARRKIDRRSPASPKASVGSKMVTTFVGAEISARPKRTVATLQVGRFFRKSEFRAIVPS